MASYSNLAGIGHASVQELAQHEGIGQATAARLRAALELGARYTYERPEDKPQIRSPADAANLLMAEMQHLQQENMVELILDTKNRVQAQVLLYQGSLHTTLVRIGEIFREPIRRNAASVIIAHNHPSGDPSPSPEDVAITKQIVGASKLLDIDVLDHLIIGHHRFISMKERGLGWT